MGGKLLQTGDQHLYENAWLVAMDDGFHKMGISRSYTLLNTGDYAGSTTITVNSKNESHTNAVVRDERTGLMWSKAPSSAVGPSSDGKLYWDDHCDVITFENQSATFYAGECLTDQVSSASAYIRYLDSTNEKMAIVNVQGTFGAGNAIEGESGTTYHIARFGDNTYVYMDYPGTQDTFLKSADIYTPYDTYNYGAKSGWYVGHGYSSGQNVKYRGLIAFDLASFYTDEPTASVYAAYLVINCTVVGVGGWVLLYPALRTWGSGSGDWEVDEGTKDAAVAETDEPTWSSAQYGTAAWGTAGAYSSDAGKDGTDAGDYDSGHDIGVTYGGGLASIPTGTVSQYKVLGFDATGLSILATQIQNAGCRLGFIVVWEHEAVTGANNYLAVVSSESTLQTYRPWLELYYTKVRAAGGADIVTDGIRSGAKEDIWSYVKAANEAALGGHSDWRVPNINEMMSIMYYSATNGDAKPDTNYFTMPGDTSDIVWTSSHEGPFDSQVSTVECNFADAVVFDTGLPVFGATSRKFDVTGYVYLVRGPASTDYHCQLLETGCSQQSDGSFPDDGMFQLGIDFSLTAGGTDEDMALTLNAGTYNFNQQTVTDGNTGLVWTLCTNEDDIPYYDEDGLRADALDLLRAANYQELAGYSDWRIPNLFELKSILSSETHTVDSTVWSNADEEVWTCTADPTDTGNVFYHLPGGAYFQVADRKTGGGRRVRLVRGGYTDDDL